MVAGNEVECRLHDDDIRKIAAFGNPALKGWQGKSQAGLIEAFREAQENLIARTILYQPPRPGELWAMNCGDWKLVEEDPDRQTYWLQNNILPTIVKESGNHPFGKILPKG